jgi:hypothetical protein
MGCGIMKVSIEIEDGLLSRAKRQARREKITLDALMERGLLLVFEKRQSKSRVWKWKPITCGGGLTEEFKDASWFKIRDEIYRGRGT